MQGCAKNPALPRGTPPLQSRPGRRSQLRVRADFREPQEQAGHSKVRLGCRSWHGAPITSRARIATNRLLFATHRSMAAPP